MGPDTPDPDTPSSMSEALQRLGLQLSTSMTQLPYFDYIKDRSTIWSQWSLNKNWLNAGVASSVACYVSHPLDLVKVRLQLQGELRPPGKYPVKYRSIGQSLVDIGRFEGLRNGLYKAISPALGYHFTMNGVRMYVFEKFVQKGMTSDMADEPVLWRYLTACLISGSLGAVIASPLYLAKIQTQTQAPPHMAVGWQHQHPSARWVLWNAPRGHRGYLLSTYQGGSAAVARLSVASTVQLLCFTTIQHGLYNLGVTQALPNSCISGVLSSVPVVLVSNPLDVWCTRMYNQDLGAYYKTNRECIQMLYRREGWRGFYKGAAANYCRTVPHMIATLLLWDYFKRTGIQLQQHQQVNPSLDTGYFKELEMNYEHKKIMDKFEIEEK